MGIENRAREGLGSLRGEIGLFVGFEVWECVFKQFDQELEMKTQRTKLYRSIIFF